MYYTTSAIYRSFFSPAGLREVAGYVEVRATCTAGNTIEVHYSLKKHYPYVDTVQLEYSCKLSDGTWVSIVKTHALVESQTLRGPKEKFNLLKVPKYTILCKHPRTSNGRSS